MKRILALLVFPLVMGCSSKDNSIKELSTLEKGKMIAGESFAALSGKLKMAMGNGGPESAVEFCSLEALPLTDSLSKHFGATIKRTALKYRNVKNAPDSAELQALVNYSEALSKGVQPQPMLINVNGEERFIAPIPTKTLCLSCHGVPGVNIPEPVVAKINQVYPNDMAIGFQEGDLRGIWSITFKN